MASGHKSQKIETPLAKARGLGAAHEGAHHWLHQRITAIANVPLVVWLVYSIVDLKDASYTDFMAWMQNPLHPVLLILLVLSVYYHAVLGKQVVIEDYVSCNFMKMAMIIAVKLGFTVLAVATIFSILKVAL